MLACSALPEPIVSPRTALRARAVALRLGERLLTEGDGELLAPRGLCGTLGSALALWALGRATGDSRYWESARTHLRRAAQADDLPLIGLFTGISGLRAVAALFTSQGAPLQRLVAQCDAYVESRLPEPETVTITSMRDFDIISGWSGARLSRCVLGPAGADRLIRLLTWLIADDKRWCCVHPMRLQEPPENDLGLAHGIAGVIAAIALSTVNVDSELDALLRLQAKKLSSRAVYDGDCTGWPSVAQAGGVATRPAWCYGGTGVASALYWVARRISDEKLKAFALDALESQAGVPCDQWRQNDFALCHGTLGNALVFASVGVASQRPKLVDAAAVAVEYAVDGLERDGGACWGMGFDMKRHDLAGELDGAAGICASDVDRRHGVDVAAVPCPPSI